MTEHNDPILQEALNDLADIQFCDNDHNQAVEEERQCECIIVVMASKYTDEIARLRDALKAIANADGGCDIDGSTIWIGMSNPCEYASESLEDDQ